MYQEIITTIIAVIFLLLLLEIIKIRKHLTGIKQEVSPCFSYDEDVLYDEAKETAINMGKASASLFQRKFRIGYSRAANLIDTLEDSGVISSGNGSKPREVLISKEQYTKTLNKD